MKIGHDGDDNNRDVGFLAAMPNGRIVRMIWLCELCRNTVRVEDEPHNTSPTVEA